MLAIMEQIKHRTQLRWNRVYKFKTKISMSIEAGPYQIKTAESVQELLESCKLRHEVFRQEFCEVESQGMDFDKYDYFFDHLVIVHKETGKIIGTYRLNCSSFSRESYTSTEFDISRVFSQPGPHLELGRACIHKNFRKGAVISLLWRGIIEYMTLSKSVLLFGCSSVKVDNGRDAALIYQYFLTQGQVTRDFPCFPTRSYRMKDFSAWLDYFGSGLSETQVEEAESLIPSLLKSYLKLGAMIACEPAFDEDFNCIDFLTILKKDDLSRALASRRRL